MLACVVLTIALLGVVPTAHAADTVDPARLAGRHGFRPDDVGFLLLDPASGRVLDQHGADTPFIPASTTKVATVLAALETLGPDFRFATALLATGTVRDGTLAGALYLRGGGDPTLDSGALGRLIDGLRTAGIDRVEGSFVFDDSLYPGAQEIDPLQPEAATYNPAVGALSVNYNRVQLRWRHDPDSQRLTATIVAPAAGGPVPIGRLATGLLEPDLDPRIDFVFAPSPTPRWLLSSHLRDHGSVFLPVKSDPGGLAAELFRALASRAGIELPQAVAGATPPAAREVARVESAPLAKIVRGLLRYSNNLTAELLGLAASRRLTGEGLGLPASADRLVQWWRERLPDTTFDGFVAANHSGLSSTTLHTPRQLAAILRSGTVALPGLLRPYDLGDEAKGAEAHVKSGTMHYADGLVGFLRTQCGANRGFVILMGDAAERRRLDATRDRRITAPPPAARGWTARAKALERDLVLTWAADAPDVGTVAGRRAPADRCREG